MVDNKIAKLSIRKLKEILEDFEKDKTLVYGIYTDAWNEKVYIFRGIGL